MENQLLKGRVRTDIDGTLLANSVCHVTIIIFVILANIMIEVGVEARCDRSLFLTPEEKISVKFMSLERFFENLGPCLKNLFQCLICLITPSEAKFSDEC